MDHRLRPQYLALLARYGLEPHAVPPDWREIDEANKHRMIAGARARGDHRLIEAIEHSHEAALADPRHPTDHPLDAASRWVEDAVRRNPACRGIRFRPPCRTSAGSPRTTRWYPGWARFSVPTSAPATPCTVRSTRPGAATATRCSPIA